MENSLKIGDLVVLKSGGPVMTVEELLSQRANRVGDGPSARCQWFAGKKMESGIFPVASLNAHVDEQKQ